MSWKVPKAGDTRGTVRLASTVRVRLWRSPICNGPGVAPHFDAHRRHAPRGLPQRGLVLREMKAKMRRRNTIMRATATTAPISIASREPSPPSGAIPNKLSMKSTFYLLQGFDDRYRGCGGRAG